MRWPAALPPPQKNPIMLPFLAHLFCFLLAPQKALKAQFEADKCKKKLEQNVRTSLFIIMTHADGVMIQWMAAEQVINGNLMRFFLNNYTNVLKLTLPDKSSSANLASQKKP